MYKTIIVGIAVALCFTSAMLGGLVALRQAPQPKLGSAADNTYNTASSSLILVGKDIDTTLVSTSTGRRLLRITNLSTTSPQALYCAYNDAAAVLYSGFTVFASSTETFTLDNLYLGALHCKFPAATSSVSVTQI